MKRFHMHVRVDDLKQSVTFYSTLFGAEPTVNKDDYAKWMLEDPRVNFAISPASNNTGFEHVGIQTETAKELEEITRRLHDADVATAPQPGANCCYAVSDKNWTRDPSGINWETFHTHGSITRYGDDHAPTEQPRTTCANSTDVATGCG